MKFNSIFTVLVFLFGAVPATFASEGALNSDSYYQVSNVEVKEEIPTAQEIASSYLAADPSVAPSKLSPTAMELDWNAMVLIGQKVIEIIKAGAPVVNIKRDAVSVVPVAATNWQQLAGWQAPAVKVYTVSVQNGFGMNVVDLRLKVSGMWGGSFDGRGQYLANVIVVPSNVRVLWGWNLDLWSENREPVNAGSLEQPKAGLGFDIRYKIWTYINEINGSQDYWLAGDGQILEL